MRRTHKAIVAVAILCGFVAAASSALAVPAFGRKTGLDCTSCHFGGSNRLTRMGLDFLVRGHRMKDDQGIAKGDKSLNVLDYMSFSSKVRYTANNSSPYTAFDVESFSIYTGGPLSGGFSYFVEYYLHERGKAASSTGGQVDTATRSKLADAYLQWNSAPQGDAYYYVRAGQIYPYAVYVNGSGGRLSISRPTVIDGDLGGGNLYTPRDRAYGLSAGYANGNGYRMEAGIVNSGGTNKRANLAEQNTFKDLFLTVEKDLTSELTFGLYGYNGRINIPAAGSIPQWEDRFTRYGVFSRYETESLALSAAYFGGQNQVYGGGHRNPDGYYLEAGYNVQPTLTGFARYDHVYNDLGASSRRTDVTFGVSQRLTDVGRLVLQFSTTTVPGSPYKRQLQAELNWLF